MKKQNIFIYTLFFLVIFAAIGYFLPTIPHIPEVDNLPAGEVAVTNNNGTLTVTKNCNPAEYTIGNKVETVFVGRNKNTVEIFYDNSTDAPQASDYRQFQCLTVVGYVDSQTVQAWIDSIAQNLKEKGVDVRVTYFDIKKQ